MPSVLQLYFTLSLFHLYTHLLGEWSSTVTSPMAGVCHSRQLTVPRWAKCIATSFGVRREGMLTDDAWPSLFGQTCMRESLSVSSFMFMYPVHCGWLGWTVILGQTLQTHVPNPMPSYLMPSWVQVHPCILCCSERGRDGPLRFVSTNFKVTPLLHMLNAHTRVHFTTL